MKDNITIKDVAKLAGVAPATVSHTLNGKRPVSDSTKRKVMKVIDSVGYIPSWNASRLKSDKKGIIGCLALDITESFVSNIIKGIEKGLGPGEYSLLFASAVEFEGNILSAYKFLISHEVDGIFFCHHILKGEDHDLFKSLDKFCPIVSINSKIDNVTSIIGDDYSGGVHAAEHLLSRNCNNLAIICGPLNRSSAKQRLEGFCDRLDKRRDVFNKANIKIGDYSANNGYESTIQLLTSDPSIDGIFCENDYIAAGAINAIKDKGLDVPKDIKIIGYDNRDFSLFWQPSISTFEIPLEEMGLLGVYKLKDLINKSKTNHSEVVVMQSKLIVRNSSIEI